MRQISSLLIVCFLSQCNPKQKQAEQTAEITYQTIGSIERLTPELDNIIHKDAKVEILADGFSWSEGPVWVPTMKALLYSDVPTNTVYKWSESSGNTIFLKPSGHTEYAPVSSAEGANGLTLDRSGDLLLCQHGDRRIAKLSLDTYSGGNPTFTTIIDQFEKKRFNSPNDLVIASNGDIYFTDPPYGLDKQDADSLKELDFNGVFKLSTDGDLTLLEVGLSRPNGLALSPDEKTLYVANSDPAKAIWMAYDVTSNGIENRRLFHDSTDKVSSLKGLPDGLKVNRNGIIFATGPGGVYIFQPDGTQIGMIYTEKATANCAFDESENVLYMTTHTYLTRVKLKEN